MDPADVQRYFAGRTLHRGNGDHYSRRSSPPDRTQHLAKGLAIGTRFHSAPVIRLADAKPLRLGDTAKADGRWRLFAFADRQAPSAGSSRVEALCGFLVDHPKSPIRKFTPAKADIDSVIDVRAVFQQSHRDLSLAAMPQFLLPAKGRYGLRDYEKMFCPELRGGHDIFDMRGIDRDSGCVVVVRPDQYIAHVLPLEPMPSYRPSSMASCSTNVSARSIFRC